MATALYPGAYKPPHRGHFEVVRDLLSGKIKGKRYDIDNYLETGKQILAGEGDDSNIDKVVVFIGGKDRNGISQADAKLIWDIYAKKLGNVQIVAGAMNPMMEAKAYAKANPNEECLAITGVRSEDDFIDLKRVTTFKNRDNVDGFAIGAQGGGVRASDFRSAILSGNLDRVTDFFPKELDRKEILFILDKLKSVIVAEMLNQNIGGFFDTYFEKEVVTENSFAPLPAEKKNKLDILHDYIANLLPSDTNLEHDGNKLVITRGDQLTENTDVGELTEHIGSLLEYMLDQGMNITPLPDVKVNKEPQDFFGKTAYYDPNSQRVVLYISNRHPKDICRSFSHEMVHHMQNVEGRLGNITTSNTNEDDALLELEKEAYLTGNITFRNWEDSIKNKDKKVMAEGRYDKISNVISKQIFQIFKQNHDIKKDVNQTMKVGSAPDDDIQSDLEFDLEIVMNITGDEYKVDGGANAGFDKDGDEIQPLLNVAFNIPKRGVNWQEVSFDIKDVVRHEIEHLTQDGENERPGKYIPDDQDIRDMIDAGLLDKENYFKLPKEVDAMIQGMYFKAKKSKTEFSKVVDDYFKKAEVDPKEIPVIKKLWNKRLPALGIKKRL